MLDIPSCNSLTLMNLLELLNDGYKVMSVFLFKPNVETFNEVDVQNFLKI